jgi:hypothetical protein
MQKVFYASLDDLWFRAHDLMDLVEYLYSDVEIGHLNRIPLWMFGLLY